MGTLLQTMISVVDVPIRKQTYLNLLYHLLALPLGIFYFVFLVSGLSLGLPLMIFWIGIPIVMGVFAGWYTLCKMERRLAISLLGENILPVSYEDMSGKSLLQKLGSMAANQVTWKGLLFLMVKLPMGMVSFTLLAVFGSLSLALLAAPFYYQTFHPIIDFNARGNTSIEITTLQGALLLSFVGVLVAILSMHISNGLAWISAKFARIMLSNYGKPASIQNSPQETLDTELA